MGRFGFGKKDGEEDSSRLALFGSRSKSKSPAPPSANPYASAAAPADPYAQGGMNGPGFGRPNPQQAQGGYGNAPRPGQQYGQSNNGNNNDFGGGKYGANKYGNDGGYGGGQGGNPYGGFNQQSREPSSGGYGGLGKPNYGNEPDANRDELFGGARDRAQQQHQTGAPPDYSYDSNDPSESRSYGAYGDRQLTAEEEEEEDIQAVKQDIRAMKQSDISSTRNAIRHAQQAIETGSRTMAMLHTQGEVLGGTNLTLSQANAKMKDAHKKTDEVKKLNDTPFFIPVGSASKSKYNKELAREEEDYLEQKLQREEIKAEQYSAQQQRDKNFKTLGQGSAGGKKQSLAERSKYQFEADSEDERMEDEIDDNLDQLHGLAKNLNFMGKAMGQEINRQNDVIDRIGQKSDKLDMSLHRGNEKLKRIR